MAKQTLPTNFKDDIMDDSMNGRRRYNVINNPDGTISLEDATDYTQIGNTYGAAQVNAANTAINESADAGKIIDDADALKAVTEEGFIAGAKAVADLIGQINSDLKPVNKGEATTSGSGYCRIDLGYRPAYFAAYLTTVSAGNISDTVLIVFDGVIAVNPNTRWTVDSTGCTFQGSNWHYNREVKWFAVPLSNQH